MRLHHTHLFASDLAQTLAYYRRWFDAEVVADHKFAGSRNVMMQVGDGRLNFYDQGPKENGKNAIHHLGIQVEDLHSLASAMTEAGAADIAKLRQLPELDYLMVEAPDGVLLELFEWKGSNDDTESSAALQRWFS